MRTWQLAHRTVFLCYLFITLLESTAAAKQPAPPWIDMDYRVVFVDELIAQRAARVFFDTKIQNFTAFIIERNGKHIYVIGSKNSLLILEGDTLRKIRQRDMGKNQIDQIQRTCTSCKLDVYISVMQRIPKYPFLILCLSYIFNHNSRYRKNDDKPMCEIVNTKRRLSNWVTTFESSGFAPYNPLSQNTFLAGTDNYLYVGAPFEHDDGFRIVRTGYPNLAGQIPSGGYLETPEADSRFLNGRADFVSSFQTKDAAFFLFREKSKEEEECCQHNTRVTRLARICKHDPGGSGSDYPSKRNFITFLKASLICPTPGPHEFRFREARGAHWDDNSKVLYVVFSTADSAPAGSAICLYDFAAFNHVFDKPFQKENKGSRLRRRHSNKCTDARSRDGIRRQRQYARARYAYSMTTYPIHPKRGHAIHTRFGERWSATTLDNPPRPSNDKRNIVVLFVATDRGSILKLALITLKRSCAIEEYRFGDPDERVNKMELYDIENRQRNEKFRNLLVTTNKRILKLPLHRCEQYKRQEDCVKARDPYCGWDPHDEECTAYNEDQKVWIQDLGTCPDKRHPMNPRWSDWSKWAPCPAVSSRPRERSRTKGIEDVSPCKCRYQRCLQKDLCAEEEGQMTKVRVQVSNCTNGPPPRTGDSWGPWSPWTPCSTRCGSGYRRRVRKCPTLSTKLGIGACFGDSREWAECTMNDCEDSVLVDQDGGWSEWSPWSMCSKTCDTGLQQRSRSCNKPYTSGRGRHCVGDRRETRLCTKIPCNGWSCWSEWSFCTGDCSQERKRRCMVNSYESCTGPRQETRTCTGGRCETDAYWTQWASWSDCTVQGTRVRERKCTPGKICFGSSREFKSCNYRDVKEGTITGTKTSTPSGRFGLVHLILSDVICFILGCFIASVIVAIACQCRFRRRRRAQRARARCNTYALRESSLPPSRSSTIQRPNNLRIVNDIRSDLLSTRRESHSTAPLLPLRRYEVLPGSSTIATPTHPPMNLSPSSPPPLPPRLNSLPHRQHSLSASYSLHKEAAL